MNGVNVLGDQAWGHDGIDSSMSAASTAFHSEEGRDARESAYGDNADQFLDEHDDVCAERT